uniref:GDNF family receptor alpha like n=1 Tax=Rattus norvegicus TaxID=10116 RepID=A0ABK0LNI9_RAT
MLLGSKSRHGTIYSGISVGMLVGVSSSAFLPGDQLQLANMLVFIFLAVRLSSENESSSQTNDCAYFMRQCLTDTDGCKQSWRSMEDACLVSVRPPSVDSAFGGQKTGLLWRSLRKLRTKGPGDSCKINNPLPCNLSIQSLVEKHFQFKGCLCTDDLHCTVNKIFGKKCTNKTEDSPLPSNLAPRSNVPRWFPRRDSSSLAVRKADCVAAAEACQESEHCALLHENFKNACDTGTAQCRTLSGRLKCVGLRQRLRQTVLWECRCGLPLEKDCVQIRKSLFGDICVQDAQMEQIPTFSQDNQDGFKEDVASGFKQMQSCLEVTEACVGDVVCNAQLALYLKACTANGNLCDVKHCQAAIRFFYQNMPFNTAQMLAFCDCAQSDIPCQQSKETLHSKPCALNVVPPPTCLSVIHTCRNDELCRTYYRTFQTECWPHVAGKCREDETCISMLGKQDLTCSGSDSCRAAYLGTFGTVLQVPCACRSITQGEEPLCMAFQHMLHSKSCFRELIYVVVCMVVTSGILSLVMLKLRIPSKKRDPAPIEIAGAVIIQ